MIVLQVPHFEGDVCTVLRCEDLFIVLRIRSSYLNSSVTSVHSSHASHGFVESVLKSGLAVSSFTLEKSPSPSLLVAQVPEALWTCEGPSYSGCTGIKLLKVYTQAVLIFTYK